ncbi:MAG TPA: hypothetical protein VFU82_00245, partial [Gammaproteobacteria bacterium]|nr:hypothetical protein [Gammaproteobacteria bacterium]
LRFLISNIDDIDKDKQPSILYGYETFILDKKAMMEMPQAYASLFLVYGKAEEQLIRKHYPEEIANKIIEVERALPVKNTTNYYSYIPLAILGGLGGWAHASHNAAKRAKKRVEATPKKMEAPQTDTKTPATITEKEITLSDIILGAIADLLDKAPKDCPAINAIDENNPLSLKKTFTFPASEHNGKTVDVRNPDRLIKNLIQFHEQQQEAFNKARGLPGVRKAEAFNVIKTKCRRLVAKHLISTEESTLKIQTRVVLTPKEKIEHLLGNEKFPLEARKPWVKLPTATYDDLLDATQNHGSDPQIKTQLTLLETTNQLLEEKKSQLNGLKKDYLSLSADYDAALNPNDVDLIRFCEKISSLQAECRPLLTDIASHVKQYELLVTSIQKRHDQLIKSETPPQETQEEHDARVQRIRDEKKRKKVEAEAKAQADIEKQAREKEIDQKRRAEREQENKERQKNAWLTRWEKTNDPKIMGALLYANTALLILNDVVNAKIKDDDYLRDACILSCTQLYEALKDLSQTVFSELLPNTETLAQYRNAFAHVAMFSDFTPNDWKRMAHDTYQHFFAFVDAYHRVKTYGDPIYIHAMPALHFLMPDNINERDQFRNLCQRYLTLKEKLSTALNDEKTLYQHEAINLLSIAMRSLVMQIDDMGNRIGLNAANKNMQLLASVRNEEAHNGVRADKATLINLSTPIKALLRAIKPENKPAKPSQVGLYQDNKKHPTPPSPFSQRTLK